MYTTIMYSTIIDNQDQALCHLFFHCCLEDGQFTDTEMNELSGQLVRLGLQGKVNIKEELIHYRSYRNDIPDEEEYLRFIINLIKPVNELALYSYCADLCLSHPVLDPREESLLKLIGKILDVDGDARKLINKLVAQRKAVELQKIF